jgi:subtilisin family serine protease
MRVFRQRVASGSHALGLGSLVVSFAVALYLAAAPPALAQESGRAVPADLLQKAWNQGKVRVIVELGGVGALPEGQLLSHAAVTAQRGRIVSDQSALRFALRGLRHRVLREFKTIPYVGLEVDHDALRVLDSLPGLATRVHEDVLLQPMLVESGPLIKAPDAWNAGWDGTGQVIAVLDTGVDKNHPFLSGKVVSEACYDSSGVSTCPNGLTSDTSPGAGMPCPFAPNSCFHGTHVAGIAAGNGPSFDGIARGAGLMAIRVFHQVNCGGTPCASASLMDIVAGLERVFNLRETYDIAAVNLSLGIQNLPFLSPCDSAYPLMTAAIGNLKSVGIPTVISSGNDADDNSDFFFAISFPACISTAISVGATSDGSGSFGPDFIMSFSNSASFLSLLAPGYLINSSIPGGAFAEFSGTSMAAPHVAGAWAVMKQQNPDASVQQILDGLKNTGKPIRDPRNGITKSRVAFTVVQLAASAYNVTESVGSATIALTRTGATFGTVSVHYATSAGSAIPGQDYIEKSGTVTFGPNETFKTLTVPVVNDTKVDGPRTVNLTLSNPGGGALLGPQDTAVLTIDDNDVGGSIQFSADQYTVNEGQAAATITLSRSNGNASGASVHYTTIAGTATPGADYAQSSGVVTFAANQISNTFTIPIVNDTLAEGPETIILQLSDPSLATVLGPRQTAVLTIVDNDTGGAFKFGALSYSASEAASVANVTVIRSAGSAGNGKVRIRTVPGGTAVPGTDYQPLDSVLDFAANQTLWIVPITLLTGTDLVVDGARTIKVALDQAEPAGLASVASPALATVTIGDNDVGGTVQLSPTSVSVLETAGNAVLTVTRTGGAAMGVGATWEITSAGTAIHDTDFSGPLTGSVSFDTGPSQAITIPLIDRPGAHGTRTIQVKLTAPTGGAKLGASLATASVLDETVGFRFDKAAYQTSEGSASLTVTVLKTGPPQLAAQVTVSTVNSPDAGAAVPGTDYTPATQVLNFLSGQISKTFTVFLKNDTALDGIKTINLALSAPIGGELAEPHEATITVGDNDLAGTFRFSTGTYTATEGVSGNVMVNITVTRSGGAGGTVDVPWSITGGTATRGDAADPGVDVVLPVSGVLQFAANELSKTIQATIVHDIDVESNETLTLELGTPTPSGVLGLPKIATLVVVDNDRKGTIQFGAPVVNLAEANATATIAVTRTGNLTAPATVEWSITGGTATRGDAAGADVDYVAPLSGVLSFAAGQATPTIPLTIVVSADALLEGTETVTLELDTPSTGWALGTVWSSTVSLVEGTVQFSGLPLVVSEGSGSKTITVTRSGLTTQAVTVSYAVGPGGSATPALTPIACSPFSDYRPVSGTLVFSPGQPSKTFSVPLCSDLLVEGDEDVDITIVVVSGPAIVVGPDTVSLTITENDLAGVVQFSSLTYRASEGQANATATVARTGTGLGAKVHWAIVGGTAIPGTDFLGPLEGDLEFANLTSKPIVIPLVNTPAADGPRTILIELSNPLPVGLASLGARVLTTLTIGDDEPTLRLNSAAYVVGEGSSFLNVTVFRAGPTTAAVSATLTPQATGAATGGTCGAGEADFAVSPIPVDLAAGQASKTVQVPICPDARAEGTESFSLELGNPIGATLANPSTATVSLTDNEVAGTLRLSAADVSGLAGTTLVLTVTRTGGTAGEVTVDVTAHDGDDDTPGADALSDLDYAALPPTTLTFDANAPSRTVAITLLPRAGAPGLRAFRVTLDNPGGQAALGSPSTVTVWILDPPS